MEEIALAFAVGLVVYFAGYFKGRADGLDYANEKMGGIVDTLRKINELMGVPK